MKIVGVLVLFGLIICPFLTPSVYSQTPEQRTDCSRLFEVEWTQFEGETVDKVTVCAEGKISASHTFTVPAFGNTHPERTTWRYQAKTDKNLISDLRTILHRNSVSALPAEVDLAIQGVPNSVLREKEDTAHFSMSQEGGQQSVTVHNIPALFCGEKPARVEEAVWDLICLYLDLYATSENGNESKSDNCGCKSLNDMAKTKVPAEREQK